MNVNVTLNRLLIDNRLLVIRAKGTTLYIYIYIYVYISLDYNKIKNVCLRIHLFFLKSDADKTIIKPQFLLIIRVLTMKSISLSLSV